MQSTRFWESSSFGQSSLLPDAFHPAAYLYMPFPFNQLSRIPQHPADSLRLAWMNGNKPGFLDWLQTGLASVHYDISEMKFHALVHYKAKSKLFAHESPPATQFGPCPARHKTVGNILLEAVYQPGRLPDRDALTQAEQIVMDSRIAADKLLQVLLDCTVALYGTETPCKAWPALLRAAARGWAIVMIKARLGSHLKKFDMDGNTDEKDPDYLFRFFFITEEFRLVDQASCPARITNLLVRMFVDKKVPLFENEEGNIMRLNHSMTHLGPPDSRDEKWLAERRQYWKTETDLLVKNLFPLDYCIRIMFGPVFHLMNPASKEPAGHTCDFLVDDTADKVRKAKEEAERIAKLPPPTKAQRVADRRRRYLIAKWELENGRCWGYPDPEVPERGWSVKD